MLGESVRRRNAPRRTVSGPPLDRRRRWLPWLIGVPLALVLPFILGYFLATRVLFPPTEVSGTGIVVPNLVGSSAGEAQAALSQLGLGPLETLDIPHPTAPAGQIIAQTPLAGQQLRPGASVQVALSIGRPRVPVPDVAGFSAERAQALLERGGFAVSTTSEESDAVAGRVIRTDPPAGEVLLLPASVTLVVSTGPPIVPDTLPPDTIR